MWVIIELDTYGLHAGYYIDDTIGPFVSEEHARQYAKQHYKHISYDVRKLREPVG